MYGTDKFGFVATGDQQRSSDEAAAHVVCVVDLCFRREGVDKLSDLGKQQPEPKRIFDFEPGKNFSSESCFQVRHHSPSGCDFTLLPAEMNVYARVM